MERMRNEGRKIVENDGKMLPEGARRVSNEGLEASGAPLGTMWAQSGRQERVKSHFKAEVEAMLGPQKLLNIEQEAKTNTSKTVFR